MKGTACIFLSTLNAETGEMTIGNCIRQKCKAMWSEKYQKCSMELAGEIVEAVKEGNVLVNGSAITIAVPMFRGAPQKE